MAVAAQACRSRKTQLKQPWLSERLVHLPCALPVCCQRGKEREPLVLSRTGLADWLDSLHATRQTLSYRDLGHSDGPGGCARLRSAVGPEGASSGVRTIGFDDLLPIGGQRVQRKGFANFNWLHRTDEPFRSHRGSPRIRAWRLSRIFARSEL